jgi:hypothetical protein
MISNIGSVQPSRNSIVRFSNNPQDLFTFGNLQTIFDEDDEDDEDNVSVDDDLASSCSSFPKQSFIPDMNLSSFMNERTAYKKTDSTPQLLNELASHKIIERGYHDNLSNGYVVSSELSMMPHLSLMPTTTSSSSSLSSNLDVFLIPDSYAEPVDEGVFSDLSEESNDPSSSSVTCRSTSSKNSQTLVIPSLLHQACYLYPKTLAVVTSALLLETSNLRKRISTPERPTITNCRSKRIKRDPSFTLPLHIALQHNGSWDVIKCLTLVAPDVIALTDGPNECNAVSVVLYQKRFDLKILSLLIQQYPKAIQEVDRYHNTSLHVACAHGAPLEVIDLLYTAYPKALYQTNILGLKPLQVAQQTNLCSVDVIDFLQDLVLSSLEQEACELMDQDNAISH